MFRRWFSTLAVTLGVLLLAPGVGGAQNLFVPTAAQLQAGLDQTTAFGATQLSTIDGVTPLADGIELAATFRVGSDDPFGGTPGETFSRVVESFFQSPPADFSGFDGLTFDVESDVDVTFSPFVQTDTGFTFFQALNTTFVPAGEPTSVVFDFSQAENFAGIAGSDVTTLDILQSFGFQIFGPSPAVGEEVAATIRITGVVPEPSGVVLLLVGGLGLCRRSTRR